MEELLCDALTLMLVHRALRFILVEPVGHFETSICVWSKSMIRVRTSWNHCRKDLMIALWVLTLSNRPKQASDLPRLSPPSQEQFGRKAQFFDQNVFRYCEGVAGSRTAPEVSKLVTNLISATLIYHSLLIAPNLAPIAVPSW